MNAMRQAHSDGWFIVFDTLTLADDRLEAFYDNPNALRDYFRDIGRMVLAAEGRKNHTTNITKIVTQSIGIIIKIGRRRVGKECRSRWSPSLKKKKTTTKQPISRKESRQAYGV